MADMKITDEIQNLVETELRKGASNSRIANLLELDYKEACLLYTSPSPRD